MGIESVEYSRAQPETVVDDKNRATYKVKWDVTTDDPDYGPNSLVEEAISFGGVSPIPGLWFSYEFKGDRSPFSFSRSYKAKQNVVNLKRWTVEVTYIPLGDGEEEDDQLFPPWARPAKYSVDREVYTRILEQDVHGWQIVNTAGKMYDEPLEQEASRGVVVIQKHVQTLGEVANYIATFSDAVNKGVWHMGATTTPTTRPDQYVAHPRTALCRDVTASEIQSEADGDTLYKFYSVTFRIALKSNRGRGTLPSAENTWDRAILERGYQYRGSAGSGLAPGEKPEEGSVGWDVWANESSEKRRERLALAAKLERVPAGAEPVLLDADGFQLPEGEIGIFTFWETRKQADFNQIPR